MQKGFLLAGTMLLIALAGLACRPAPAVQLQQPIRIGVLAPLTGPFTPAGREIANGARLFVEERRGRLAGRPLELIIEDTEGRSDVALTKARKLVERDGAQVLLGLVSSAAAFALRDYVTARRVPLLISGFAVAERLTMDEGSPYIFRTTTNATQPASVLGQWAYQNLGYRKVVILATDTAGTVEVAMAFARAFTQSGGQIVQELYVPLPTTDFAPFFPLLREEAEAVASIVVSPAFARQYQEFGLKDRLPLLDIHQGFTQPLMLPAVGEAATGVITAASYVYTLESPENRRFVRSYRSRYQAPPGFSAESTYLALALVERALESIRGQIQDVEAFRRALKGAEVKAPRGRVRFDAFQNLVQSVYVVRIEEVAGELRPVVLDEVPNVSQFWIWDPDTYLQFPRLRDLKGTWGHRS